MRAELRGGGEVVDDEVAVGDGVEGVLGDALEAEVGGLGLAVEVEVEADRGAGAERQLEAGLPSGLEPRAVAVEHPEVRQQVLRERRDLRALQVGVRGQHRLDVVGGPREQQLLQRGERRVLALGDAAQVQPHVGDHLVVAAAAGVQAGAGVADELREPALDGHVHVLVGVDRDERAGLDLAADGGEAVLDGLELVRAQDAGAEQRAGVRDRALDVLAPQAPVEGERAVERHERGRALAGEAAGAGDGHLGSSGLDVDVVTTESWRHHTRAGSGADGSDAPDDGGTGARPGTERAAACGDLLRRAA